MIRREVLRAFCRAALCLGLSPWLGGAEPLHAQAGDSCAQGEISYIFIDNNSIFDPDDVPMERLGWAFRLANRLHVRTQQDFIAGELLFRVGDCYDPFILEDSERLLRRFSFIAEADVFGIQQDDGTWHAVVVTRDEWSTRLEVTAEFENGVELRNLSLSELNFLGRGAAVTAFLAQDDASRRVGGQFFTPRVLGTNTNLLLAGGESRVGNFYTADLNYPFLGENGRTAWRVAVSRSEDYFEYSGGAGDEIRRVLLPVESQRAEATWARRFGTPGNLSLVGVGISRETLETPNFPGALEVVQGNDFDQGAEAPPEAVAAVQPQTFFASGTRVNFLFSQRNIRFIQRTGLSALRGVQDLEMGSEVSLTLGATVGGASEAEDPSDLHTRFRIYGARETGGLILISQLAVDGRQVFYEPQATRTGWRDLMFEGDLLAFWQPPALPRHTFMGRLDLVGGWTMDRPFQLTLGGPTGVRGFREEDLPGGRRAVLNLEDRLYLGWPRPELFDLGLTAFMDVGRVWAGDAPFGQNSGWVGSIGGGLRLGFPAGSRDVIRIDLAFPVDEGGIRGPVLRIALADLVGLDGGLADPQMERSRLLRVGPDRFNPRR